MFIDAVKSYSKAVFNKNNIKWVHIMLLFALHIVALYLIKDTTWVIVWTLLWIITVAPFSGWYIAVYKTKDNKKGEESENIEN